MKFMKGKYSSPEAQFILQCLRSELFPGTAVKLPAGDLDWDLVYTLLEENRLAAHFYTFSMQHESLFPDALLRKLKQARGAVLLYGDQCKLQVQEVLTGLTAAGIPVIVLKGWALIQWLYKGDHGQRFCEDIDILVPMAFVSQAEDLLRKMGYAALKEVDPGFAQRFSNAQAYRKVNGADQHWQRFLIGFHWGLTHYPYFDAKRINTDELFNRSIPLNVAGEKVAELSFEDQFIYTCAHLALHHRNAENILNFFEIAAILQRAGGEMDWQVVADRAAAWGYGMQVRYVLAEIEQLWPVVVPKHAIHALAAVEVTRKERWIDWLVASTKGNRFRSALVEMLALPGWDNKFTAAFKHVFPGREYMHHRYGVRDKNLIKAYWVRVSGAFTGVFRRKTR